MRKSLHVEIKNADLGQVEAVFATFEKLDHDGDVAFAKNFTDKQPVVISAYGHKSWQGQLPYGTGVIRVGATEAVMEGQFTLKAQHAADAWEVIKAVSDAGLQEWSYNLANLKSHRGTWDGQPARFLDSFDTQEVSPVLKGASIGTTTLSTKGLDSKQLTSMIARMLDNAGCDRYEGPTNWCSLDDFDLDAETAVFRVYDMDEGTRTYYQTSFTRTDTSVELGEDSVEVEFTTQYLPKGMKFHEHSDLVMAQVKGLIERAQDVMSLRAEKGKSLSPDAIEQFKVLQDQLGQLVATPVNPSEALDELQRIYLQDVKRSLQGAM